MKIVLFYLLLISGGVSAEDRKPLRCKNPSGKLWTSILNKNCGQSVCKKNGGKASWTQCPRAATEAKVEEVIKNENENLKEVIEKKIEESLNSTKKEMANMADDIKEIRMEALKTSENMEKNLFNISENLEKRLLNISADVKRTSKKLSMMEENLLNITEDMKSKLQNLLGLLENHTRETTTTTTTTTTTSTTTTTTDNLIRGVIVSGGRNSGYSARTEVFFPSSSGSGSTCSLQSLPSPRRGHTLDQLGDGVLACGGADADTDTRNTCDKFDGTSWSQHSTLQYSRADHTSLAGQHGLLLMGGRFSRATTELVGGGEQYNLQQNTRYACGITEPGSDNTIILTGGYGPISTVAIYGYNGFIGALPSLQIARFGHGCGMLFVTGKKVFVVAGGYNSRYLDSTELLYEGEESWVTGQALPRTLGYPASVSLADSVLLIGGRDGSVRRSEIISINSSLAWSVVGTLQQGRSDAAAAAVTFPSGHLDLSNCPE